LRAIQLTSMIDFGIFAELFDNGGDPMATKHLLTGVAVVAALAFSAPVLAQQASPGGNPMGMPGPSPGGPGLTPYSTGAPPPAPNAPGRMPAGGRITSGERIPAIMPARPPSASDTTSATPPTHHHARASHGKMASHHPSRFPNVQGNVANQLNQAELARLQQGAPPMTSQMAPPPPQMQGGNSMGMPGPNTGGPGLTPYSSSTPMGTTGGGAPYRP
jgi:hypothetical protein